MKKLLLIIALVASVGVNAEWYVAQSTGGSVMGSSEIIKTKHGSIYLMYFHDEKMIVVSYQDNGWDKLSCEKNFKERGNQFLDKVNDTLISFEKTCVPGGGAVNSYPKNKAGHEFLINELKTKNQIKFDNFGEPLIISAKGFIKMIKALENNTHGLEEAL